MGLFGKKEKDEKVFGFVSENKGITHEQAREMQDKLQGVLSTDDESGMINAAARLMTGRAYQECIQAYTAVMEKFPKNKDTCEMNIGAAYYFLGDYDAAIAHYLNAREAGMDKGMIDDNIWEACETACKKTGNAAYGQKYIDLCPQGAYLGKAKKLLG